MHHEYSPKKLSRHSDVPWSGALSQPGQKSCLAGWDTSAIATRPLRPNQGSETAASIRHNTPVKRSARQMRPWCLPSRHSRNFQECQRKVRSHRRTIKFSRNTTSQHSPHWCCRSDDDFGLAPLLLRVRISGSHWGPVTNRSPKNGNKKNGVLK
jgi:hypothetical protein